MEITMGGATTPWGYLRVQPLGTTSNGSLISVVSWPAMNSHLAGSSIQIKWVCDNDYSNLTLKIKDGNNIYMINEQLYPNANGHNRGIFELPNAVAQIIQGNVVYWEAGTCNIELYGNNNGSYGIIATKSFFLSKPSVNVTVGQPTNPMMPASIRDTIFKPSLFNVYWDRAGFPLAHLFIEHYPNGGVPIYYQTLVDSSGFEHFNSNSALNGGPWPAGTYTIKLLVDMNTILAIDTLTIIDGNTLTVPNSVIKPNGFSVNYYTEGYQNDSLKINIKDGNNLLRIDQPLNGFSGTYNYQGSTSYWDAGTCTVDIIHLPTGIIIASETFTLIQPTASITVPNVVTKPNTFSVDWQSSYPSGTIKIEFKDGNNALRHTQYLTYPNAGPWGSNGTYNVPSTSATSGWDAGTCTVDIIYIPTNSIVASETFMLMNNCESFGLSTDSLWIDNIVIGNIENSSGDDNGYGDYSNLSNWTFNGSNVSIVSPIITDSMEITLDPGFHTHYVNNKLTDKVPAQGIFWNVWIDFNRDGDFDDNGELALQQEQPTFLRGDANSDGQVNMSDMIYILSYLFQGGDPSVHPDAADVNDNGFVEITDAIYLSNYLFGGTQNTLPEPFGTPGIDPTDDVLAENNLVGIIIIPANAEVGETKMRIQAKVGSFASTACEVFSLGEVEDYTVEIMTAKNENSSQGLTDNSSSDNKMKSNNNASELTSFESDLFNRELSIKTYPNPSNGIFNLSVEKDSFDGFNYQVMNLNGQVIKTGNEVLNNNLKIDLTQNVPGIYLVIVESEGKRVTNKVIIN